MIIACREANIGVIDNKIAKENYIAERIHHWNSIATGASGFSPEISLGLVEPMKKVKSSLRKAYNTPPSYQMKKFTFRLEFAIEQNADGGIRFRILDLEAVKAQAITIHHLTVYMKVSN